MDLAKKGGAQNDMPVKAEVWDKDPRTNCHLSLIESLVLDTFLHMHITT